MEHLPKLARFSSKLLLQILPSVSATVIGGYLLAQIHVGHTPDAPPPQIVIAPPPARPPALPAAAPTHEAPTAREERAAMRKVLKQRREHPETPEVVHPVATAQPANQHATQAANPPASEPAQPVAAPPAATASATPPASMDSISPHEPVEHAPSHTKAAAVAAPPRRDVEEHARTDGSTDYVPAPPPGLPQASGIATNAPPQIAPPQIAAPQTAPPQIAAPASVAATQPIAPPVASGQLMAPQPVAPAPVAAAPQLPPLAPQETTTAALPPDNPPDDSPAPHGPVGAVFSTLSSIVGHAANATGNTVNWVIDLPGKAISAGGRAIGGPSSPPPPARFGDGES